MVSFNLINLGIHFNIGPSLTAVNWPSKHSQQSSASKSKPLSIPWHTLQQNPSLLALLKWNSSISSFYGRDEEMGLLTDWLNIDTLISVKFLTGLGGTGKSRLAAEFARYQINYHDWVAGFIEFENHVSYTTNSDNTLFIIDNLEITKIQLGEFLQQLTKIDQSDVNQNYKIRVLLITRQEQKKWTEFISENEADTIVDQKQIKLREFRSDAAQELYNSAVIKASETLGTVAPPISRETIHEWLSLSEENSRPLFIVSAAIYSASVPSDPAVKYNSSTILKKLAEIEIARLRRMAMSDDIVDKMFYARIITLAIIMGPTPFQYLINMYQNIFPTTGTSIDEGKILNSGVESALGAICDNVIRPIKPDIIASVFTLIIIQKLSQEVIPFFLWTAIENNLPISLLNINRIIYDVETTIESKNISIEQNLQQAIKGDIDRCQKVFYHLNNNYLPTICNFSIDVCHTLIKHEKNLDVKASAYILLSNMQTHIGQYGKAKHNTFAAKNILEKLYKSSPEKYDIPLANALSNLACDCKDKSQALSYMKQCLSIYKFKQKNNPISFQDYFLCLGNAGVVSMNLGEHENAIVFFNMAIEGIETHKNANVDEDFIIEKAIQLSNLSCCYAKKLDFNKSLIAAKNALDLCDQKTITKKDLLEPVIATCCLNIATSYPHGVINTHIDNNYERAIIILTTHSPHNFLKFGSQLAKCCRNYGNYLFESKNPHGALKYLCQARLLYGTLELNCFENKNIADTRAKISLRIAEIFFEIAIENSSYYLSEASSIINKLPLNNSIQQVKTKAELYLVSARMLYLTGDIDKAICKVEKAYKKLTINDNTEIQAEYEPEFARCHYILGYLFFDKKNISLSLENALAGINILSKYMIKEADLYQKLMDALIEVKTRCLKKS